MKQYIVFFSFLFVVTQHSFAQKDLQFGTDTTFEVATWNIEHFPKNGQITIDLVVQFIEEMNIDLLGLQEIESEESFNQVLNSLPGWDGFWEYYDYTGMAYIYNSNVVEVHDHYKILTGYNRELPRAPLVAEILVGSEEYILICNHYKCCGNGTLDEEDLWDEEKRRYDASVLIKNYIDTHFNTEKVILLGDLNDELLDDEPNNVFQPFFDDDANYMFADISIAESSASNWSYPSWPSHLDHILVTNEIFTDFTNGEAEIATVKPENELSGGWNDYDENVSDHRPIALRLPSNNGLSTRELTFADEVLIYPNPCQKEATIILPPNFTGTSITLHNSNGQIIEVIETKNQRKISVNTNQISKGVYYIFLPDRNPVTKKLIIF